MSTPRRPPYVVPATKKHTATVILVHGFGDTGLGWLPWGFDLHAQNKLEHVKFVFPNGLMRSITAMKGEVISSWCDVMAFVETHDRRGNDHAGTNETRTYITSLIATEIESGILASQILLGGFSQGGAMALYTGLSSPLKLGGLFCLSSHLFILDFDTVIDELKGKDKNGMGVVFLGHGEADRTIKIELARRTAEVLEGLGWGVEFHEYAGLAHSINQAETDDLVAFIEKSVEGPAESQI